MFYGIGGPDQIAGVALLLNSCGVKLQPIKNSVNSVAYLRSAGRWRLYALHLIFRGRRASQKISWLASTSGVLLLRYSDFFLVELGNRDGRRAGNHCGTCKNEWV